jgi:hypothetical protein
MTTQTSSRRFLCTSAAAFSEPYSSWPSSFGWFAGRKTSVFHHLAETDIIDKDRMEGSVKHLKGSVEEAAGTRLAPMASLVKRASP